MAKWVALFCLLGVELLPVHAAAQVQPLEVGGFRFEHSLVLPVSPEQAYDYLTGDISGWWDHSMSENPLKFYIDARPGGGFYEIFDERGDGVQHAQVIYAERAKRLTMRGPLGLNGSAVDLVCTYRLSSHPGGTRLDMEGRAAGEMQAGWPEAVAGVWHHFLFERLKPFVERDCAAKSSCTKEP